MSYKLLIKQSVYKDLRKVPAVELKIIWNEIQALKTNPFPQKSAKLKGYKEYYRLRIGKYRVVYSVKTKIEIIVVVKVGHRKEIYRFRTLE